MQLCHRYDKMQPIVDGSRICTVVKSDTLSGIGQKLGVKWQDIATRNGIVSPYTIYPGQRLTD